MIARSVFFGLLVGAFVLGLEAKPDGGLIEIDDNDLSNGKRKGSGLSLGFGLDDLMTPFGQSDVDSSDGGINIVGPVNPSEPGDVWTGSSTTEGKDKVISDPWRPFYDPENKNLFGQSFPPPEEVPKVQKRPENHFPEPEPQQPIVPTTGGHDDSGSNGGGFQEVTEAASPGLGFPGSDFKPEFPGMQTEAPTGGHELLEPKEPQKPVEPQYPEDPLYPVEPKQPEPHKPVEPQYPVEPKEPEHITPKPEKPKDDKHHWGLGGILGDWKEKLHGGWNKQTTEAPESTEQKKPGHGGLGGLFDPWKNVIEQNKDSVNKAVESVKEAGEKVVEAGKDVLDAGLKIGQSLPGIGKHLQNLNKHEEQKKHSFFPNILGRAFNPNED